MPKTGGNSIQHILLPHSDDVMVVGEHRDGKDRFEIQGKVTPKKHASLQDYYDRINDKVDAFCVVVSMRHPFERAVSFYFSPHRWFKRSVEGYVHKTPIWDENKFFELLRDRHILPATDYLKVEGMIYKPKYIIRLENFESDLHYFTCSLSLPVGKCIKTIPHVNTSNAPNLKKSLLKSREIRDITEEFFKCDMDFFQYETYNLNK